MAIYKNSVQTEQGRVLETRARNGEGTIEFSCIKIGSGTYAESENIREITELKEVRQTFFFSGISPARDHDYLVLESVLKNDEVEEGYYLTEVGIYACIKGEIPVLYCIGLVDEPDYIPPYTNGITYEITLQSLIKCYDADNVTIQYDAKTYATAEMVMRHMTDKNNPHGMSTEQLHLENVDNTSDMDKPVSNAQQAALDTYYQQATGYTDRKIAVLINGAPEDLDTLKEIADAMAENHDVVEALNSAIGKKANQAEMDSLLGTKLDKTGDTKDAKVTFGSSDTITPAAWTNVAVLKSGETHKSIFAKVSAMFKNIRYLWGLVSALSASGAITEVKIVEALPADAASHPTTFYWVKG